MPNLYIIATPIGNLEDITLRALRVLKDVNIILCEDTRHTKKLLAKYEINTPTISYHQHSKLNKINKIVDLLECGKNLALVSDAGTPGISDPGNQLIKYLIENKIDVEIIPIPGPSAVISALSVSGFPTDNFIFMGFVPHKKGRQTFFKNIAEEKRTVAFYESPHRILKALDSMQKFFPKKEIVVCRELTKIYETVYRGKAKDIKKTLTPDQVKGEFVVVAR
ncbi:MAG: 16S rRNA (cytidine(1402)-2'-O)-methyltransferase [Candidatus Andersenbacteria bacterium]|nr:16S rRNA (cytidine(1402)-2'-O)-methyltransferase [Candidatus Andersenbacteria bacterium]